MKQTILLVRLIFYRYTIHGSKLMIEFYVFLTLNIKAGTLTYRNRLSYPLSAGTQCSLLQSTHPLGSNPVRSKPGTTLGHLDLCGKRRRRGNPFRIIAYSLLGALK